MQGTPGQSLVQEHPHAGATKSMTQSPSTTKIIKDKEINFLKYEVIRWTLIQYNYHPYKKGNCPHREHLHYARRRGQGWCLQAKECQTASKPPEGRREAGNRFFSQPLKMSHCYPPFDLGLRANETTHFYCAHPYCLLQPKRIRQPNWHFLPWSHDRPLHPSSGPWSYDLSGVTNLTDSRVTECVWQLQSIIRW